MARPQSQSPAQPAVVRPFRRDDRQQLTELVNAHVGAVVPGACLSVDTVTSQLQREPGEFIVDPWVTDRRTLVAEQRGRVVAAAHLLRYGAGPEVGDIYRDTGEIRWLLCWPEAGHLPDASPDEVSAGDTLAAACLAQFARWGVERRYADGALPAPAVYGLPEQWPHVRAILERAGFVHEGHTEVVLLAAVADLAAPGEPPIAGLAVRRTVGVNGTRLSAWLDGEVVGYVEVDTNLGDAGRLTRMDGWADVGNLHVAEPYRRRGVATWLVAQAAEWLRLAGVSWLLDYAWAEQEGELALLDRLGFRQLTRTDRGWVHRPGPAGRA
jgi:ribosomal protein S18 acetylase RimI-like enzyme